MRLDECLGKRVKTIRERLLMNQPSLAANAGLGESTLKRIEQGKGASYENVEALLLTLRDEVEQRDQVHLLPELDALLSLAKDAVDARPDQRNSTKWARGLVDLDGLLNRDPADPVPEIATEKRLNLPQPSVSQPAARLSRARADRFMLTVQMSRTGDTLKRVWIAESGVRQPAPDASLTALWRQAGGFASPSALCEALDTGDTDPLSGESIRDIGDALLRLLVGESPTPLLKWLFGEGRGKPSPWRHPVRVRICTEDAVLQGLPWRVTMYHEKRLVESGNGWTFEITTEASPTPTVSLSSPCDVLIIAPNHDTAQALRPDDHVQALTEVLAARWPRERIEGLVHVARDLEQVKASLRGLVPHIIYYYGYYGHAHLRDGELCLSLGCGPGEGTDLPLSELKRALERIPHRPPFVVYLNGCLTGAGGWRAAGPQLMPLVPCVIANRTTAWSLPMGEMGIAWFQRLFHDATDPVTAACQLPDHQDTRVWPWATLMVHADWRTWSTEPYVAQSGPPIKETLDRLDQKRVVYTQTKQLVRSRSRRAHAFVAFAGPGNRLDLLGKQLEEHLQDQAGDGWPTEQIHIPFEGVDAVHWRSCLERTLEPRDGETLRAAIRRRAPRAPAGRTRVLLLNWEIVYSHPKPGDVLFKRNQLAPWLACVRDFSATYCPSDVRLVHLLKWELPERLHTKLEAELTQHEVEIRDDTFHCDGLQPAGDVRLRDLVETLEISTRCPTDLRKKLAKLVLKKTLGTHGRPGHYDGTLAQLERGEATGWRTLYFDLERELGHTNRREAQDEDW